MDNNQIESIEAFTFEELPSINLISLKNNQLKMISSYAFNLVNIEITIDLFNNTNLSSIESYSFNELAFVRLPYESILRLKEYNYSYFDFATLDLGQNQISTIYKNSIKGKFKKLIA